MHQRSETDAGHRPLQATKTMILRKAASGWQNINIYGLCVSRCNRHCSTMGTQRSPSCQKAWKHSDTPVFGLVTKVALARLASSAWSFLRSGARAVLKKRLKNIVSGLRPGSCYTRAQPNDI